MEQKRGEKFEWYLAEAESKHVRQVVFCIPSEAKIPSRVESLLTSDVAFMAYAWAVTAMYIDQLPLVVVKANKGAIELLENRPVHVAFAYYYLKWGGLFQIFVHVNSPEIEARNKCPFIVERSFWIDEGDYCELIKALITQKQMELCFVSGENADDITKAGGLVAVTGVGLPYGEFGLAVNLPLELQEILMTEWNILVDHHNRIPPSKRNYEKTLEQYNRENPLEQNPILERQKFDISAKDISPLFGQTESIKSKKIWWQFWK